MKRLILLLTLTPFLAVVSCDNSTDDATIDSGLVNNTATAGNKNKGELPELDFQKTEHDFGKITQGERVRTEFKFKNTGKTNLIISDAQGSCGCTVPDWPKEPIRPGAEGVIKVEFNSEGKAGLMEKTVTIVTNCEPATRVIRIKAEIIVPQTSNQ
jgi:hypothetical protein